MNCPTAEKARAALGEFTRAQARAIGRFSRSWFSGDRSATSRYGTRAMRCSPRTMANGAAVRCARDPAGNQAALDLAGEPGKGREDLPRHRDQVQPGLDAKRRLPLRITLEDAGVVAPRTQDNTVQF